MPQCTVFTSDTVVFCTKSTRIIDYVMDGTTQAAVAGIHNVVSGKLLTEEFGPDLIILDYAEAYRRYEQSYVTTPQQISEANFTYWLECLPPQDWVRDADGESFKVGELVAGSIATICVNQNDKFYAFQDTVRTRHRDCCKRVADAIAAGTIRPLEYDDRWGR